MLPEAERALARVLDVHGGDPWHGWPTTRLLDGVAARQAAARPKPGVHSIWEIVLHMTAWTGEVASRLTGAAAKDPVEGDWPPVGEQNDARWRTAVAALDAAQRHLEQVVGQVPDERWHARVGDTRQPPVTTATHLQTLEGLALHHAYHGGQIGLLKRWLRE